MAASVMSWRSVLLLIGFIICGSSCEPLSTTMKDIQENPEPGSNEYNEVILTCTSDRSDLYYNFTWIRHTGDQVHLATKNDELLTQLPELYTVKKDYAKLTIEVTGAERWETGLFGCRRNITRGPYPYPVMSASTEIVQAPSKKDKDQVTQTFGVSCEPSYTIIGGDSGNRAADVGVYRVHYYDGDQPDNWTVSCWNKDDDVVCYGEYPFQNMLNIGAANVTDLVKCKYNAVIDVVASSESEAYNMNNYYQEGTTLTLRCGLKSQGRGITWSWTSFEGAEYLFARDGVLEPGLSPRLTHRYNVTQIRRMNQYESTFTINDGKSYDSGIYGCETSGEHGKIAYTSSRVNIAGKIKSVTLAAVEPLDSVLHIRQGNLSELSCTVVADNMEPHVTMSLAGRTLGEKQFHPSDVPLHEVEEILNNVTVVATDTKITCDVNDQILHCLATGPFKQRISKQVTVKVIGCGAGSLCGMTMNFLISTFILAFIGAQ